MVNTYLCYCRVLFTAGYKFSKDLFLLRQKLLKYCSYFIPLSHDIEKQDTLLLCCAECLLKSGKIFRKDDHWFVCKHIKASGDCPAYIFGFLSVVA